ncbi:Spo0B domain-containing protein [Virgibacillus sediminis]|uniref:Spo0B domain-containing protein n=1 Tax=Virgibacillus sediminis TaxID=202260 RepID=A0ABV7A634_9BACI
MEEKEVINVLQHYRHDLMNNLQVVQGYLTMGRQDKVEKKVGEMLRQYGEESKLMGLKAPGFTLWVLRFNHIYNNLRLKYRVKTENKNLASIDREVTELCRKTVEWLEEACDETQMYDIILEVTESEQSPELKVKILLAGGNSVQLDERGKHQDKRLSISKTANGIQCELFVPFNI